MFLFKEKLIFDVNVIDYFKYLQYILKEMIIFIKK